MLRHWTYRTRLHVHTASLKIENCAAPRRKARDEQWAVALARPAQRDHKLCSALLDEAITVRSVKWPGERDILICMMSVQESFCPGN